MELNAKQKAEELVEKYFYNTNNNREIVLEDIKYNSIQCAIIDTQGKIDMLNKYILLNTEIRDLEVIGNSLLNLIKYNLEVITHLNDMVK